MSKIVINSSGVLVDGVDIIDQSIQSHNPTKTSELENDIGLTTTGGSAYSADSVDSAVKITENSASAVGGFGPSANVTIKSNTGSIIIPTITVNAKGQVTKVVNYTYTLSTY